MYPSPVPAHFPGLRICKKIRNFVFFCERKVVPISLGRKNYGHSTSPEFCVTTMRMYSILVTAMHNGLEPGSYLRHVLDHAPRGDESSSRTREIWQSLLPWNIDKDRLPWNDRSVTDALVSAEAVQT